MTLGKVNISCVTSKLSRKNCLVIIELVAICEINITVICLPCVVTLITYLLLPVIIIQCTVKIGLVAEMFFPNYQSLFFKLTQLA